MMENELSEPDKVKCPKCGSTQIAAGKHGFSAGKAVGGALLTGGIGLLAGLHGSKKIEITCLNCGHKFKPGQQVKENSEENQISAVRSPAEIKKDEKDGKNLMGCLGIIVVAVIIYFLFFKS